MLTQELYITQTTGVNSEHKDSEIERFLDVKRTISLSQNSKDSVIVSCQ